MKITFPHMGPLYITAKVILDTLGLDYVLPPSCGRQSLERGSAHSPEGMCMPFKTILGDLLYGLDHGADVILFGESCGQCRQGYFGALHDEILHELGYTFTRMDLNLATMSFEDFKSKLAPVLDGVSGATIARAFVCAARVIFAADALFELARSVRCRELERGAADCALRDAEQNIRSAHGYSQIMSAIRNAEGRLRIIPTDSRRVPLKIAVIGEIFVCCESFLNLEIERRLGGLGAQVYASMSPSYWVREHLIKNLLPFRLESKTRAAAAKYVQTRDFGGHGVDTVGSASLYSGEAVDGIVHIYPLTCMPEIIAGSALPSVHSDGGVPILTLVVDELTGEAGFQTRLEAFADMLEMRRANNNINNHIVNM